MKNSEDFFSKRVDGLVDNFLWWVIYTLVSLFSTWGVPKIVEPVKDIIEVNIFYTIIGYLLLFCAFWALIYVVGERVRTILRQRLSAANIVVSKSPLSRDNLAILTISNTHKNDLENCYVKIIKTVYSEFASNNQKDVPSSNKNLKWENTAQRDGFITLIGGNSENLEFAWAKKSNNVWDEKPSEFGFSYITPETSIHFTEGNYFVTIKIEGSVNRRKVNKEKTFLVSFYAHKPRSTSIESLEDKFRIVTINEI